jgi:hypothetical protein
MRAWQEQPPRGRYTDHPFVLQICSNAELTTKPQRFDDGALTVLAYSRTRLHIDRNAWEALPPDGVLLLRIRAESGVPLHFCASRSELDTVFGEVRQTPSWDKYRYYSFPELPPATKSFLVDSGVGDSRSNQLATRASRKNDSFVGAEISDPFAFARHWWDVRGPLQDSEDYLRDVAAWREFWRPKNVRVLLIAESHVAEAAGDSDARVRVPETVLQATGVSSLPDRYVRLIYCLGYGLNGVCDPIPRYRNIDTPFWGIFEALASGHPLLAVGAGPKDRVHRRILVLQALRERGIWLADASVVALYHPSGIKLFGPSMRKKIIRQSYEHFVWPAVEGDKPEEIWVIGKEVGNALRGRQEIDPEHVISQPGDRDAEEYRKGLARLTASVLCRYSQAGDG